MFLQNLPKGTQHVNGARIKDLLAQLAKNGCKICGSVPINYPYDNNADNGILTVNYVSSLDPCSGTGLCKSGVLANPIPLPISIKEQTSGNGGANRPGLYLYFEGLYRYFDAFCIYFGLTPKAAKIIYTLDF